MAPPQDLSRGKGNPTPGVSALCSPAAGGSRTHEPDLADDDAKTTSGDEAAQRTVARRDDTCCSPAQPAVLVITSQQRIAAPVVDKKKGQHKITPRFRLHDNPLDSNNLDTFYHFADQGYATPHPVDTNISERIGPNFLPDPEDGDEAAYSGNENSPRHTPTGLQILGLWVSVQNPPPPSPREPSTLSQALGGNIRQDGRKQWKRS
ncbi:hypothetical protein CLOM_g19922 [Closterium sp. NIES-68]|nr:hypothetical protein CLOM_g19922 [Closterium sp. NIES-68]